ncbi:MAG: hypothetical protein ACKOA4_06975 [Haliscomenobacter sp.]
MNNRNVGNTLRVYHRYLGFFLAGVMAMYAVSGIIMIFRQTDFLKKEKTVERSLPVGIKLDELGKELKIKELKIEKTEGNTVYFKQGTFDLTTGVAKYQVKELPLLLEKMSQIHKATTKSPLFFLNIFFGLALLFFVLSAFWMFIPSSNIFKKGMYFTVAGILLVLILLFV